MMPLLRIPVNHASPEKPPDIDRKSTDHGVLLLDKPAGLSSNAALQRVRRLYSWSKAGHTGTLDPLATGLLPICLGEATKFSHALLDADKTYEASIRLGVLSSTGDAEGVLEVGAKPSFSDSQLQEVLASFRGVIEQIPPMYSALKKEGRPLYQYARAGTTVIREPRKIIINQLQLTESDKDTITLTVGCSKGTYLRVLAEDIGRALGCGAYLLSLRRTRIRDLTIADATSLEALAKMDDASRRDRLLPVDQLVQFLPALRLSPETTRRITNGLRIPDACASAEGVFRLYDFAGNFIGIGESTGDGLLAAKRLVAQPQNRAQEHLLLD